MLVAYDRLQQRVWICRRRIHHGMVGVVLLIAGVILIADDWHDRPWLQDLP